MMAGRGDILSHTTILRRELLSLRLAAFLGFCYEVDAFVGRRKIKPSPKLGRDVP